MFRLYQVRQSFINVNMITMSSHKIYGPKGIGLLLIDEEINLEPIIVGGGQELSLIHI